MAIIRVAVVLGGNCPWWQIVMGANCPGWQLSLVAIVRVAIVLGGSCPGGGCPGGCSPDTLFIFWIHFRCVLILCID